MEKSWTFVCNSGGSKNFE